MSAKDTKTLIVAEKPSVGRDLAKVLSGSFQKHEGYLESADHVISWAVGHLVTLAEPEAYESKYKRWRLADLPIVPEKFKIVPAGTKRNREQLKTLVKLLKRDDVDRVINACDAGREGELIFALIYQYSKSKKTVERLWLSSLTKGAITSAFNALRPASEMVDLEAAARSRSEADWIVGMNATRAASIRLRPGFDGVVSLGRVQTPTLALLVRRELEIQAFIPETYHLVEATFEAAGGTYQGRYMGGKRLKTRAEADLVAKESKGAPGEVTSLESKEVSQQPPLLFDLTSLQREANSRYGFTAKRTLAAAQKLYEQHKALTYPRTSSRYLPTDLKGEVKEVAAHVGAADGAEYGPAATYVEGLKKLPTARIIDDDKVTDHHAIIPTNADHDLGKFSADELKVYDLVARRFLAVFHPEARFRQTRVRTLVAEKHEFRSSGKVLLEAGWRGVYGEEALAEEKSDDSGAEQALPDLKQGEAVKTADVGILDKETKPPRRYSDASLLAAMETAGKLVDDAELREEMKESGIGTPATRSNIIERLIAVEYVEREGRAFMATPKGIKVIELLADHALTSPELTGQWEKRLGAIERGEEKRKDFMSSIGTFTAETVEKIKALEAPEPVRRDFGDCPSCGKELKENRRAVSCWHNSKDTGCGFVIWKKVAGKTLSEQAIRELIERGRTSEQISGLRSKKGRSFKAHLKLAKDDAGAWKISFDEDWAKGEPPAEKVDEEATPAAVV